MCPRCGGFIIRERMSDSPSWSLGYTIEVGKCLQCARRFEGEREWGQVGDEDNRRSNPGKYADRKNGVRRVRLRKDGDV